jgi:hypothetical protein
MMMDRSIRTMWSVLVLATVVALFIGAAPALAKPWSFGIIADTQWTVADDGKNPNSVAVDIINQVNEEFITRGVKFVIAVGDLTDSGSNLALDTRATTVQALYNAGIGFFPLRGNHESSATAAAEFVRIFPQTQSGVNNQTPDDAFVTTADDNNTHPVPNSGSLFASGYNLSSPSTSLYGLSYAFDFNNARFVLLDQFTPPDSTTNTIESQQDWINDVLASRVPETHAFVFSHKGLITEDHVDNLFGSSPAANDNGTDAFISSLQDYDVRYLICGHDHMHDRTLVTTTDGIWAKVTQIVAASDSSKFYSPANPSNDAKYDVPAFGHTRQIPLSQDLYQIGYYLVTVDGPRVTVDYYGVPSGQTGGSITTTPPLSGNWQKRETFGYSLNGREFLVAQGKSYTVVRDSFNGTAARILSGSNGSTANDGSGRALVKAVDTGWTTKSRCVAGDILTLWGMAGDFGSGQTDTYTLSMTYKAKNVVQKQLKHGLLGLAKKDANGYWINAVDNNFGGAKKFVLGPWKSSYSLGTYGVDLQKHTVWAVINHTGDFAVARFNTMDCR